MLHRFLKNGVEVVVKENRFAKMVAIQCWVGAGSLHENENEFGMAHCLEHMLFKGTENFGVGEISGTIEAFGGDINAYTTFDHTVYYLTLSSLYAQQGVEILSDAIFHSSFDELELTREKEVILEEIKRSLDSPGHLIGRKIFEEIYRGTDAARPIIGYEENVTKFTRDDLLKFYRRWYQPANIKVVAVGDFDSREMFEWLEKAFGNQPSGDFNFTPLSRFQFEPIQNIGVHLIRGDYEQPRLEIAFRGPQLENADTIDLDLAAFALGSGEASRLNKRLRDQQSVASSLGASLYSPIFGGIFEVSAIPLPENFLDCMRGLGKELALIKDYEPVSQQELERAQANLRADRLYQEETVAGQARSLGFSLLTSHKTSYDAVYTARVEDCTGESIRNALHRWLDLNKATIVGVVPKDFDIDEELIRTAYLEGIQSTQREPIDRFNTLSSMKSSKKEVEIFRQKIMDGVEFVYRRNPNSELFNLIAVTEGGLRSEDEHTAGQSHCFANLLASATEDFDSDRLTEMVEGNGAVLAGFSGKDSVGLKLQCFNEHARDMTHLWAQCLLKPIFPAFQWKNTLNDVLDDIRSEKDSPAGIAIRSFQENLYAKHPYRFPTYGTWDAVKSWNERILQSAFQSYRDQGPWVISGVGNWEAEDAYNLVSRSLENWKLQVTQSRQFKSNELTLQSPNENLLSFDKQREQTHIVQGTLGLSWKDPRRAALDILSTIFGGSGGRMFVNLRDRDSLAYTVTPILTYGCHPGVFGAYIACAPNKVEQALSGLKREFDQAVNQFVTAQELDRAKNYLIGGHESEMQRGDAQAMTMSLMEAYGVGYDDFLQYSDRIVRVDLKEVQAVARDLLNPDHLITVLVGPTGNR